MPNFDFVAFCEEHGFAILSSSRGISFQLTSTTTGETCFMVKPSEGSYLLIRSYGEPCENLSLERLIEEIRE